MITHSMPATVELNRHMTNSAQNGLAVPVGTSDTYSQAAGASTTAQAVEKSGSRRAAMRCSSSGGGAGATVSGFPGSVASGHGRQFEVESYESIGSSAAVLTVLNVNSAGVCGRNSSARRQQLGIPVGPQQQSNSGTTAAGAAQSELTMGNGSSDSKVAVVIVATRSSEATSGEISGHRNVNGRSTTSTTCSNPGQCEAAISAGGGGDRLSSAAATTAIPSVSTWNPAPSAYIGLEQACSAAADPTTTTTASPANAYATAGFHYQPNGHSSIAEYGTMNANVSNSIATPPPPVSSPGAASPAAAVDGAVGSGEDGTAASGRAAVARDYGDGGVNVPVPRREDLSSPAAHDAASQATTTSHQNQKSDHRVPGAVGRPPGTTGRRRKRARMIETGGATSRGDGLTTGEKVEEDYMPTPSRRSSRAGHSNGGTAGGAGATGGRRKRQADAAAVFAAGCSSAAAINPDRREGVLPRQAASRAQEILRMLNSEEGEEDEEREYGGGSATGCFDSDSGSIKAAAGGPPPVVVSQDRQANKQATPSSTHGICTSGPATGSIAAGAPAAAAAAAVLPSSSSSASYEGWGLDARDSPPAAAGGVHGFAAAATSQTGPSYYICPTTVCIQSPNTLL
eukprot:GHVU01157033.1.p1 GENE.GHVU01157033.1~~GHVU01157033.1.p1  ORF type:complete len:626 (+),score=101.10 GHVU01157033.1:546-2423(+)